MLALAKGEKPVEKVLCNLYAEILSYQCPDSIVPFTDSFRKVRDTVIQLASTSFNIAGRYILRATDSVNKDV